MTEKSRKLAKEPHLEKGKAIDKAAAQFVDIVDKELMRLSKMAGDYATHEAMKARAAEQARNQRLTELEQARAKELMLTTNHDEADAVIEQFNRMAEAVPEVAEPVRAAGQRVIQDWDITVTDIWALARAHPGCVKIEPLIGQVKALLNSGMAKVAGVKAERIIKSDVRLTKKALIDV